MHVVDWSCIEITYGIPGMEFTSGSACHRPDRSVTSQYLPSITRYDLAKSSTSTCILRRRHKVKPMLLPHRGWPMAAGPASRLGSIEPGEKTGLRLSPRLAPSTSVRSRESREKKTPPRSPPTLRVLGTHRGAQFGHLRAPRPSRFASALSSNIHCFPLLPLINPTGLQGA